MILRAVLLFSLLAVAGYGAWEVRRWGAGDLISPFQRRIRLFGLFFLLLTLGLWLGGTYLPDPPRHPKTHSAREIALRYIGYWTVTVLSAVPLLPLALLDARENLRRLAAERRELYRDTLTEPGKPGP